MRAFNWIGDPVDGSDDFDNAPYISISGPSRTNGLWDVTTENVPGSEDGTIRDDDAASAWSTVAYVMCENGATAKETDALAAAAPDYLEWCFDGQVGMHAYDKNEVWDG